MSKSYVMIRDAFLIEIKFGHGSSWPGVLALRESMFELFGFWERGNEMTMPTITSLSLKSCLGLRGWLLSQFRHEGDMALSA